YLLAARLFDHPPEQTALCFYQRHYRNDAAPRRTVIAARWLTFRRRAPLGLGAAGLRQLVRPRLDRPIRVIEAELAVAGFIDDDDDTDMAAALESAEQNLVGQRFFDVLLDHPRHRPAPHQLVLALGNHP